MNYKRSNDIRGAVKDKEAAVILVCPLYWGTGHATRVQIIARELKKRGHKIFFAAPPALHGAIDKQSYTELVPFSSPPVHYSARLPLYLSVFLQLPRLTGSFIADRLRLPGILRKYGIDLIISDNRFGLWSKKVPSIYITHQLRVMLPRPLRFASPLASALHRAVARRYERCWVPDLPGTDNLGGRLSHECRIPPATRYIGILSRLEAPGGKAGPEAPGQGHEAGPEAPVAGGKSGGNKDYSLALLSGPEPQRSMLEDIIITQARRFPGRLIIVAGQPGSENKNTGGDITRYPWAGSRQLARLVSGAACIICRPGYSTLMDLARLGKTALLVPTPGQPEQEYLAAHLSAKYGFAGVSQKELSSGIIPAGKEKGWPPAESLLLQEALDELFKKQPSPAR